MKKKYILFIIILILMLIIVGLGPIMSRVEQAKYSVIQQQGTLEVRDYGPMIIAETEVAGDRETSIKQGFLAIADYIFGNNLSSYQVPMTAPVTQQANEKIPMTSPVIHQRTETGSWKVHFFMPSHYTIKTLPQPKNEAVKIKKIPAKRFAVIRFSGLINQKRLEQEKEKLETFIMQKQLTPLTQPIYAFFNPPWTLPFLRRNEVMIEIKK